MREQREWQKETEMDPSHPKLLASYTIHHHNLWSLPILSWNAFYLILVYCNYYLPLAFEDLKGRVPWRMQTLNWDTASYYAFRHFANMNNSSRSLKWSLCPGWRYLDGLYSVFISGRVQKDLWKWWILLAHNLNWGWNQLSEHWDTQNILDPTKSF